MDQSTRDELGMGDWWCGPTEKPGPDSRIAGQVTTTARWLWDQDTTRRDDVETNLRRFSGYGLRGLFPTRGPLAADDANLRLNITKSAVETLVSKVGANRPRPRLLTNGADHSLRKRTKQLQRFLDGVFAATDAHTVGKDVFRDAMLAGTGVAHFFPDVGKRQVKVERVFPLEVLVDPVEAVNGNPLNYFRVKFLDRQTLIAMFPDQTDYIRDLAPADVDDLPEFSDETITRNQSMVCVYEAWHLATHSYSGKLNPGRHVLSAGNILFVDETWDYDFPPFAFFHWTKPVRGFWGDSAVGEIRGIEREMNSMLQKVQRAMKIAGQPWVLAPASAKVKPGKLTNESGLVVEYQGQVPPTIQVHQPIHPQLIQQIWSLKAAAFEQLGTNEQQAAAIKPPGIESGRALEQLSEEHLVRFKSISQDYERLVACDFSRQFIRVAKELDSVLKGGYKVQTNAGRTRIEVKWSEASISPDDLFIEVWPVSILPNSPSGRTAEVERWQQAGWISPQRAMALMELPDLESETDLATADSELVEWQIEHMLDDGEDVLPLEVQNLEYARQRVTYALEKGIQDGVPQANLDKAMVFLDAAQSMLVPPPPPVDLAALGPMGGPTPLPGVVGPAQNPLGMPAGGGMGPGMPPPV